MIHRSKTLDTKYSRICLGGTSIQTVTSSEGNSTVRSGRVAVRRTETGAEERDNLQPITELHREMMYLERVATQPSLYPEILDRPFRRISGVTLYSWIGKRLNMGKSDVEVMMKEIEEILIHHDNAFAW